MPDQSRRTLASITVFAALRHRNHAREFAARRRIGVAPPLPIPACQNSKELEEPKDPSLSIGQKPSQRQARSPQWTSTMKSKADKVDRGRTIVQARLRPLGLALKPCVFNANAI